jgi:hypothetical protein
MNARSAYSRSIRLGIMAVAVAIWLHACGFGIPACALAANAQAPISEGAVAYIPGVEDLQALARPDTAAEFDGKLGKKASWDIAAAIRKLEKSRVPPPGRRRCVVHVKAGLAAGGVQLDGGPVSAKDYGPVLEADGFQEISGNTPLRAGDVVIIQSALRRPHGHMAMYNGRKWISDFIQIGLYPGPQYRKEKPEYKIYRRE